MMKIGAMFSEVFRSLFNKPTTHTYPVEKIPAPDHYRGKLVYNPETCTGCMLCVKDCPAEALELITIDRKAKKFVMRYHTDRCIFCSQCVENCRFSCLQMSNDQWELAALNKEPFTIYYGKEEDVRFILEPAAAEEAEQPCPESA